MSLKLYEAIELGSTLLTPHTGEYFDSPSAPAAGCALGSALYAAERPMCFENQIQFRLDALWGSLLKHVVACPVCEAEFPLDEVIAAHLNDGDHLKGRPFARWCNRGGEIQWTRPAIAAWLRPIEEQWLLQQQQQASQLVAV